MSKIPIFTLAIATFISTNDHLERADRYPYLRIQNLVTVAQSLQGVSEVNISQVKIR